MNLLKEVLKPDVALANLAIAGAANHTGRYIGFGNYRKCLFAVGLYSEDGILDTEEVTINCLEATDAGGSDAQALVEDVVVTGLVNSTVCVTDLTAGTGTEVGDTVSVNGIEFTFAATTDVDELEFEDGAGLVDCIAAHCPGLSAENNAGIVTISATEVGDATVTLVETAGGASGWTPKGYSTYALALVELSALDLSSGFSHVAVQVENGATNDVAAVVFAVRGNPYHSPVKQAIAAEG